LEELGVDGKIILAWIIRTYDGNMWNGLIRFKIGTSGNIFEGDYEYLFSING
jgi:hypothetical protein